MVLQECQQALPREIWLVGMRQHRKIIPNCYFKAGGKAATGCCSFPAQQVTCYARRLWMPVRICSEVGIKCKG